MHSEQKRCRHSITIIVLRRMPRHTGHVSSELIERTAHVTLSLSRARRGSRWISYSVSPSISIVSSHREIGLIVVDRAPVARAPAAGASSPLARAAAVAPSASAAEPESAALSALSAPP